MKKILMIFLAFLMIAACILPARQCGAADTTFYGTYRVRLFNTNNAADYSNEGAKFYSGNGSSTTNVAPAGVSAPFSNGTNYKGTTDNNSWIDQRFRLAVESKVSDKLRGFVQLEIGNTAGADSSHIWGSGAAGNTNSTCTIPAGGGSCTTTSDQNNRLNARQYYLSFNLSDVRVKAGRQLFGDAPDGGQSFMVTDDNQYYGLIDGGLILISQVDGFFVTTQKTQDPFNLLFGYAKLTETSAGSTTIDASDKDSDLYIMQGIYTQPDTMTAAGYFVYNRDRTGVGTTGTNTPWWLGGSVEKKFDQINLKAHIAYKGGKWEKGCQPGSCGIPAGGAADDLKYSAYAIDVDASMPYSPATTVGVAFGMGSGDSSETNTTDKDFTAVAGSYGNQLGVRPAIFFDRGEVFNGGASLNTTYSNSIDNTTLGNITFIQLYGIYKESEELTVTGLFAHFRNTENKRTMTSTTSREWESKLGNEIDLTAVYKLYKELSIVGQIAWFMPGKGITSYKDQAGNYTGFATDDTVSEYFARIQYDF